MLLAPNPHIGLSHFSSEKGREGIFANALLTAHFVIFHFILLTKRKQRMAIPSASACHTRSPRGSATARMPRADPKRKRPFLIFLGTLRNERARCEATSSGLFWRGRLCFGGRQGRGIGRNIPNANEKVINGKIHKRITAQRGEKNGMAFKKTK